MSRNVHPTGTPRHFRREVVEQRLAAADIEKALVEREGLDPPRLSAFERVLFECARPGTVVLTTPNRDYNRIWESLPAGQFRHPDHRFEWTRQEFQTWAAGICERLGYTVQFAPVGPEDAEAGSPTQMGVFTLNAFVGQALPPRLAGEKDSLAREKRTQSPAALAALCGRGAKIREWGTSLRAESHESE